MARELVKREISKDENGNDVTVEYYDEVSFWDKFKTKKAESDNPAAEPKKKMTTKGKVVVGAGIALAAVGALFGISKLRNANGESGEDSGSDETLNLPEYDAETEAAEQESPVEA